MGNKDIISKHVLKNITADIANLLLKLDVAKEPIELLETEQQRIETRHADLVARVHDLQTQQPFILHVEIQNDNDAHMPLRMLRYYTDIQLAYPKERIRQFLIYIGKAALTMPAELEAGDFIYRYHILDMHTIDCQQLLIQDTPDALVLAVLCDFKSTPVQDVINYIVKRLRELLGDDEKGFRDYFEMLETLSENRNLRENFDEARQMLTKIDMEKLPSFSWGLNQGREEGLSLGREEGLSLGREEGLSLGREEGLNLGREEGLSLGREEGLNLGREEIAIRLLPVMDDKSIANFTNISMERVQELRQLATSSQ